MCATGLVSEYTRGDQKSVGEQGLWPSSGGGAHTPESPLSLSLTCAGFLLGVIVALSHL